MSGERTPLRMAIVAGEESGDLLGADLVRVAPASGAQTSRSSASAAIICRRAGWTRCSTPPRSR